MKSPIWMRRRNLSGPLIAIANAGAFQARQFADVFGVHLLPPYRFARALAAPRWILMRSSPGLGF
jgi:hypothetical protein